MVPVAFLLAVSAVFPAEPAFSDTDVFIDPFEGVPHAEISVNGVSYKFPIGLGTDGRDRTTDVYLLKKALNGDVEAREVFLGGAEERAFYIGRENPLWLFVNKKSERVIKP